jgi:hypothetical protein
MALPIPRPEPVTNATLPEKGNSVFIINLSLKITFK